MKTLKSEFGCKSARCGKEIEKLENRKRHGREYSKSVKGN